MNELDQLLRIVLIITLTIGSICMIAYVCISLAALLVVRRSARMQSEINSLAMRRLGFGKVGGPGVANESDGAGGKNE
jgi:hypothetical protein